MKDKLQPFDKVLVRDSKENVWKIDLFVKTNDSKHVYHYKGFRGNWNYCIPYTEDLAYLIGTTQDIPVTLDAIVWGSKVYVKTNTMPYNQVAIVLGFNKNTNMFQVVLEDTSETINIPFHNVKRI